MHTIPVFRTRALRLGLLAVLVGATSAWAQVEPKLKDRASVLTPVRPPLAAAVPRELVGVLVIPDAQILRGAALTDTQREAILWALKIAPFKTARLELSPQQQQALRLPSGELFQPMSNVMVPQALMQQLPPAPGLAANPCQEKDVEEADLSALRDVLAAQLKTRGADQTGFLNNYPGSCRREQLLYLVKSARVIAAK